MPDCTKPKTVTILSGNLASGGTLASVTLARALQPYYDVQLIGSLFGSTPWPGIVNARVPVEQFPGAPFPAYLGTARKILRQIRGDVVIAHQLRFTTFGIALMNRLKSKAPCAVYIDDDDIVLTMPGRSAALWKRLRAPNGDLMTRIMFRLRGRADATLCGSDYFSERFGGQTVRLGRDESRYEPAAYERDEVRGRLGIGLDEIVLGFIGNPRPHVGIEDLVTALDLLDDGRYTLLVIPAGKAGQAAHQLFDSARIRVRLLEDQASERVPEFLAASDLVAIPQRVESISQGQLPARLVEAMAMAKPIVTTHVSDIPKVLGDAGLYVAERSPAEIADALKWLREHPGEARAMGNRARQRFLELLSLSAMGERLAEQVERLMTRA